MNEAKSSRIKNAFADGVAIDRALTRAARDALLRHKLLGQPVAVWREGQVVWLSPEEFPLQSVQDGLA